MGQYFLIVNTDKKEYLHPHCLGSGLKLWEIAAANALNPLTLLLRQSTESGGGDIDLQEDMEHVIESCKEDLAKAMKENNVKDMQFEVDQLKKYIERLKEAPDLKKSLIGHWSGDRITIVGDYDDSKLYDTARDSYINISHLIIEEYNKFIDYKEYEVHPDDWHKCPYFRRKEYIAELRDEITMYKERSTGFSQEEIDKQVKQIEERIAELQRLPKEPNYPSQKAHLEEQKAKNKEEPKFIGSVHKGPGALEALKNPDVIRD